MMAILVAALAQPTPPAGVRTIDRGTQSNMDAARQVVVRSEADWTKLWRQHAPDRKPPAVDFGKEIVVAVFAGSKPTSGYEVAIVAMREASGGLVVDYQETQPARDAMTAQVLTSPYHIVAIPKREGEVRFAKGRSEK